MVSDHSHSGYHVRFDLNAYSNLTVNGAEILGHWGGGILATCTTHGIRVEAAFSTHPLPAHLLDGPATDLQALGQFPLANPLRTLHPNVLPLLFNQARPSAKETAFGPRLRLARD